MYDLSSLPRLRQGVRRRRASTWDRTGGNADAISLAPGEVHTLAEDAGPGQITHLWFTILTPSLFWGRELVLRMYWDGEVTPSVEVPFGDFFGVGNGLTATYSSALLEMAPRGGLALHSWFPMPFADGFRVTIENQSALPVLSLYCYVDYELWPEPDDTLGRFHAWWNRRRGPGLAGPESGPYELGTNLSAAENYLVLDAVGRGTYVGMSLNVYSAEGGWYGEGDDMIFVDSRDWPPTLHGTGTEDYFGTSWSPAEPFSFPRYGQPVADREDWAGFSSVYRFHLADPIPFEESVLVTLEQGHANDRRDDYSSVAYWYQRERVAPLPPLPPVLDRLPPWPPEWQWRADAVHELYLAALADPTSVANVSGLTAAAQRVMQAVHARDWDGIDTLLAWVRGEPTPLGEPTRPPEPPQVLAAATGQTEDTIAGLLAGRDAAAVVAEILGYWAGRFDADNAADAALVLGFSVDFGGGSVDHQLVIADGACRVVDGRQGHERLAITTDLVTLVRLTNGDVDAWEAALRGRLAGAGDTSMALRFPALFGVGIPAN